MTTQKILGRIPIGPDREIHILDIGDDTVDLTQYEPSLNRYGVPMRLPKGVKVLEALAFALLGVALDVPIIDATDELS